jgi:two-component system CheB/CheR fusion protein
VAACATGEEACSIAIAVFEHLEKKELVVPFQIFATDINPLAIEKARSGIYQAASVENVSPERLKKYFTKIDGQYHVVKAIRDVCVFATHNLLTDPPFSQNGYCKLPERNDLF